LNVLALVPAHNEAAGIADTIRSLKAQTHPVHLLVIADNCTDDTVRIARECGVTVIETVGNRAKKAGALNSVDIPAHIDYVFTMDADTILHHQCVENGVRVLNREPRTGGVCSAYRALPLKKPVTHWQRFLWRLQNIEFALANAWRVENYHSARVLPGVAVLYRRSALEQVRAKFGEVWATDSLVEDYRLTLNLKDVGWDCKSSLGMVSWSDVPLQVTGPGGLWRQRTRWYSGTIDELRRRGFRRHSRYETLTIGLLMSTLLQRLLLYGVYAGAMASGRVNWLSWWLLLPGLAASIQLYRLRYGDQVDRTQRTMTATLVANELYAIWREVAYAVSIWLSYRRPNRAW